MELRSEDASRPRQYRQPGGRWVEQGTIAKLSLLCMEDRFRNNSSRVALPPSIYSENVAPYLSFNGPVPDQLYVIGGRDSNQEPLNVVEMFDSWNGRWITCPPMLARRAGCAAAPLPSGCFFVCGGYDEQGIVRGVLDSCEVFDPVSQEWSDTGAALLRARWGHGCSVLGSSVIAVGGCALLAGSLIAEELMETLRSCEAYDSLTNQWRPAPSLNVARAGARVVTIAGGKLAAVGGCDDVFGRAEMLATVEILNQGSDHWDLLDTQLGVPRTTAAAVALDAERILVMGGAPSLSSAEVYHVQKRSPDHSSCHMEGLQIGDMAEGRMGCQAVAMRLPAPGRTFPTCTRQCVVVVGGENGDEDWSEDESTSSLARQFSTVLVFDAEEGAWRPTDAFPQLPTPRTAMALCVSPGTVAGYGW
ncbi:IVNS1ABP [Symbiodinium pilosum]|uniref:IVNS1ABP protein n=1 Tax=Symbiodinium pilosum TaxID=2952 RepID=A0A812W7P5_SYMPI|nr:IVNS1ABP [Symbiodinium pilosum]